MANHIESSGPATAWVLPPLILHPFTAREPASGLAASARLSLIATGLFTPSEGDIDWERQRLLEGRYSEFRMVCLIGKDVARWLSQCVDFVCRHEELAGGGIREQSFADLLIHHMPAEVSERFERWGVVRHQRILSRAIGLASMFPHPPAYGVVTESFLLHYYYFADAMFECYQRLDEFQALEGERFRFSVFTSAEYAGMIEHESRDQPEA